MFFAVEFFIFIRIFNYLELFFNPIVEVREQTKSIMKEFFENLKQIRLQKHITLEDIARSTRLSLQYLEDIEAGRLENLPKGYDRIFFKRYLKEIGEDTPEVWRDFNLFFGGGATPESSPPPQPKSSPSPRKPLTIQDESVSEPQESVSRQASLFASLKKGWVYKSFWIGLTAIILGSLGYFAYQQYQLVKASSQIQIKEITLSDFIQEMQQQDSLTTSKLPQNNGGWVTSTGPLHIQLKALYRTWIREIRDRSDTSDYILPAGLTRKLRANDQVQFMMGRADGVEIWINGQNIGTLGAADEVVLRLVITRDGIVEKKLKKVIPKTTAQKDSTALAATSSPGTTN